MLLNDLFARSVEAHGDRPAIDVPPGTDRPQRQVVTYRELAAIFARRGPAGPAHELAQLAAAMQQLA
jgi:hypothetical protein